MNVNALFTEQISIYSYQFTVIVWYFDLPVSVYIESNNASTNANELNTIRIVNCFPFLKYKHNNDLIKHSTIYLLVTNTRIIYFCYILLNCSLNINNMNIV